MVSGEQIPTEPEVREQLSCILANSKFARRQKDADLLTLLVNAALKKEILTEEDIKAHIFRGPYRVKGSHVRTHVNWVRKFLREYYADEGAQDIIVILMPVVFLATESKTAPRNSYPVLFQYNRDVHLLLMGALYLAQLSPTAIKKALIVFDRILARNPENVSASIRKVECLCLTAIYRSCSKARSEILEEARSIATLLVKKHPEHCPARIALAIAFLCSRRLPDALASFRKAEHLNHSFAKQSLWWPVLLLASGTIKLATDTAWRIADLRDDTVALLVHGFCLYFARDFAAAQTRFTTITELAPASWIAHLGLTLICLAHGDPKGAMVSYTKVQLLVSDIEPAMPGVGILAASRAMPDGPFPTDLHNEGQYLLESPDAGRDWVQIALIMIDVDPTSAMKALQFAYQCSHPLLLLLPIWPIFDPLRNRLDFQQLIDKIGFPAGEAS
jgi:tetratricopeptide (TPR) repeat protein